MISKQFKELVKFLDLSQSKYKENTKKMRHKVIKGKTINNKKKENKRNPY